VHPSVSRGADEHEDVFEYTREENGKDDAVAGTGTRQDESCWHGGGRLRRSSSTFQ